MSSSHGEVLHLFLCTMQSEERKYQNYCHIFLHEYYLRYRIVSVFPQVPEVPCYYQKSLTSEMADLTIVRLYKLIRAETQKSIPKKTGGRGLECRGTFWLSSFLVSQLLSGFHNKLRKYYFYNIINIIKGPYPEKSR